MLKKRNLFILFCLVVLFNSSNNRKTKLEWDVFGYYLYLPAQFIYHDISLEHKDQWLDPLIEKYKTTDGFYQANMGPRNKYVMKYTMGLSFAFAPFFFIADFIAPRLGYDRDGFSPPYQILMMICGLLFSLIGIFFSLRILTLFFSETVSLITLALIVFGTNYFVMSTFDNLMPHNFTFTLFAVMLYYIIKWYDSPKIKYMIISGICLGWAILIRPTSIVVIIIPLLWNVQNLNDFKNRISFFSKYYLHVLLLGIVSFLVFFPQMYYWKSITGEWLYYSYPGEKLNFRTPHPSVIFSYKKGWLLYTPLMAFSLIGFINLYFRKRPLFFPIFIFFIINTYIISCWDTWWYGGSFSQRAFVEGYVFLMFPFANFISDVLLKRIVVKFGIALLLLFFVFLNLFQTNQAINGVIAASQTTKEYYWMVFLKNTVTPEQQRWLSPAKYADGKDELRKDREYKTIYSKTYSITDLDIKAPDNNIYTKPCVIPLNLDYSQKDHYLITKLKVDTLGLDTASNITVNLVTIINRKNVEYKYREKNVRNSEMKKNNGEIQFSVLIPPQVKENEYLVKTYTFYDKKSSVKILSFTTYIVTAK